MNVDMSRTNLESRFPVLVSPTDKPMRCGLMMTKDSFIQEKETMSDNQNQNPWTDAERDSFRKLLRMAGILFIGILLAGTVAAGLSSLLGTL